MHNLSDILDTGVIIASSEKYNALISWNESATFLWWVFDALESKWKNVDIKTAYNIDDLSDAQRVADNWLAEVDAEEAA